MNHREQLMLRQMEMLAAWEAWAERVAELCDAAAREVELLDQLGGHEATARNLECMVTRVRRLKP